MVANATASISHGGTEGVAELVRDRHRTVERVEHGYRIQMTEKRKGAA